MNTFAAMKPAPRPAEALNIRSGAEAGEASPDGTAEAFGAVLGALKEGRPTGEARREDKTRDETTPGPGPSPAESPNPLLGLVEAGGLPQGAGSPMDPAALQSLLARAAPGGISLSGGTPSTNGVSGSTLAGSSVAGQTASGQAGSESIDSAPAVPVGMVDVAAGIALALEGHGAARNGLMPRGPAESGAALTTQSQTLSVQTGVTPQALATPPGEARTQVTILQQETHFAPVRPRLVAGQALAMSPMAGQPGTAAAPVTPAPLTAIPAAADTLSVADLSALALATPAVEASVLGSTPASPTRASAPAIQAGASTPTPVPELAGRSPRADTASVETATVASPAAQRIAGQTVALEAIAGTPGEVPAAEAGPRDGIGPVSTAPGGALPAAATLGEPARQVAEAVASELSRPAAMAAGAAASPGGEGPLRLLTIQLRPMDLGTVLVRMRLRDGQLEMSLHASREETAALLRQDGTVLTDLLRSSGYHPDTITIASNGAGAPSQGDGGRPGSGASFQPGGGQPQSGANPDQPSRRQGGADTDERADLSHERTHETTSSGPDRSGLYL